MLRKPKKWIKRVAQRITHEYFEDSDALDTPWQGLARLREALDSDPAHEDFAELSAFVDRLSECVQKTENGIQRPTKDYRALQRDIDELLGTIESHLPDRDPTTWTHDVVNLCRTVDPDLERLVELSEPHTMIPQPVIGPQQISHLRRVKVRLACFVLKNHVRLEETDDAALSHTTLGYLSHAGTLQYGSSAMTNLGVGCCTEGTRVQVMQELQEWALRGQKQRVKVVSGAAGVGKTTIAYTLCRWMNESRILNASCFHTASLRGLHDSRYAVACISHQLAQLSPAFRRALGRTLRGRVEIMSSLYQEHLYRLLTLPLFHFARTSQQELVIVIDGLEILENKDMARCLFDTLSDIAFSLPVRLLVTVPTGSSTHSWIRGYAHQDKVSELCLDDLDNELCKSDIATYLKNQNQSGSLSELDLDEIARQSGGSFSYALSAMRYTMAAHPPVRYQLGDIASIDRLANGKTNSNSQSRLFAPLLESVLHDHPSDIESANVKAILHVLLCACEPLGLPVLASITGQPQENLNSAIFHLSPLIEYTSDREIALTNRDFRGFLIRPDESGEFYCNTKSVSLQIAQWCFDQIEQASCFNLPRIRSSNMDYDALVERNKAAEHSIDDGVMYAFGHWQDHVNECVPDTLLTSLVLKLLSERLFTWIEITIVKSQLWTIGRALEKVQRWLKDQRHVELESLIRDACRFAGALSPNQWAMNASQVYLSALAHWPSDRLVYRCYEGRFHKLPKITVLKAAASSDSGPGSLALRSSRSPAVEHPLTGHANDVNSVAYSPDGAYIASGSDDKTIRMWDAHTGQQVGHPLTGHTEWVRSVAYSPDGAYIASGSWDRTIRMWDAHTGQQVGHPLTGHTDSVWSVAYSPDGAYIASGSEDNTIRIWDARTGQQVGHPLTGHTDWVRSVAYSPDGAYIASGSEDNTIRIWDAHTGQQVGHPLTGHTRSVYSVAYSPDGACVASGSSDRTIRIWDAHTGQPVGHPLTGHTDWVRSVAYSPDGAYIASGSEDNTIRIWDAHTGQQVGHPLTGHTDWARSVAYSPDGAYIASGSTDNTVRVWDVESLHCQPLIIPVLIDDEMHELYAVDQNGWVLDKHGDRLVHIPSYVRRKFLLHQSEDEVLALDLRGIVLGEGWYKCYKDEGQSEQNNCGVPG
ncbi:Vegetative incompatibility protein HET-E-1 [Ceratobasidium sp. AG-Ba]|nr:Vegetative incompatibility protein HET-E-1 [Ceratobasidium sp. AG-Ba]